LGGFTTSKSGVHWKEGNRDAADQGIGTDMGIRFECPNGHQLHVKTFLAGMRGICPECDARFLIPLESGGQATVVEEPVAPAAPPMQAPPAVAAPPIAVPPPAGTEPPPQEVWYIRPATGDGQYGPADTVTFRGWVAEGRVSPDSWVWRTGWSDWKNGIEALALLNDPNEQPTAPPPQSEPAPPSQPTAPIQTAPPSEPTAPVELAAQKKQPTRRSARRQRAKKITVALSFLVLVLLAVLVMVLFQE
jgi:hypothetical protein